MAMYTSLALMLCPWAQVGLLPYILTIVLQLYIHTALFYRLLDTAWLQQALMWLYMCGFREEWSCIHYPELPHGWPSPALTAELAQQSFVLSTSRNIQPKRLGY